MKVGEAGQQLENQNQKNRLMQCEPFILYPCRKGLSQQSYGVKNYTNFAMQVWKNAFFFIKCVVNH